MTDGTGVRLHFILRKRGTNKKRRWLRRTAVDPSALDVGHRLVVGQHGETIRGEIRAVEHGLSLGPSSHSLNLDFVRVVKVVDAFEPHELTLDNMGFERVPFDE